MKIIAAATFLTAMMGLATTSATDVRSRRGRDSPYHLFRLRRRDTAKALPVDSSETNVLEVSHPVDSSSGRVETPKVFPGLSLPVSALLPSDKDGEEKPSKCTHDLPNLDERVVPYSMSFMIADSAGSSSTGKFKCSKTFKKGRTSKSGKTSVPSSHPSAIPSVSAVPSSQPSMSPSESLLPSSQPSISPTSTGVPSSMPSSSPSVSLAPSSQPSDNPSVSAMPSSQPSLSPTSTGVPSSAPSERPSISVAPSSQPSMSPTSTGEPSSQPSGVPSYTSAPSSKPSANPSLSAVPSLEPSISSQPTVSPQLGPMLSSRYDSKCWEVGSDKIIQMKACDRSNPDQQFFLTAGGKLRVGSLPGYCFDSGEKKMALCRNSSLPPSSLAEQIFEYNPTTEQITSASNGWCVDYFVNEGVVSMWSDCHGGTNQQFFTRPLTASPTTAPPTTAPPTTPLPTTQCSGVCLEAVPVSQCPPNGNLQNCYANLTPVGSLCEGDGECGTNNNLNQCDPQFGDWDIYRRVPCGGQSQSGEQV